MRTISAILAAKGPLSNTMEASATVLEALGLMQCLNTQFVVVMRCGKYAGVFTESDYTRKVILRNRHSHNTLLHEVMTADLPFVSELDTAGHAILMMNLYKTRYLPVFEDFAFSGMITFNDLMREAMRDKELMPFMEETILSRSASESMSRDALY
ncbi:CBS domain-containing protein [Deminuibacter soli]|uniref:CBS domain-containing protein n=1 Tax=Deminuibacter soli TaxID=2291815 RepID=A0A3E1NDB9_9BACT|nr:CBS domain-containing protein [Deminuibacter soli]RFM25862.1 CBS domain-containing protein [Deminuibacter soli]